MIRAGGGQDQRIDRWIERLKDSYAFRRRGMVPVKGKAEMEAYLLLGRNSPSA